MATLVEPGSPVLHASPVGLAWERDEVADILGGSFLTLDIPYGTSFRQYCVRKDASTLGLELNALATIASGEEIRGPVLILAAVESFQGA